MRTLWTHLCWAPRDHDLHPTPGLNALDRMTVGQHGSNQYTEHRTVVEYGNVTLHKPATGNSNTYALRKLRKDREDLHGRVLAGLWPGESPTNGILGNSRHKTTGDRGL
jgi:hypothetical protein